MPVTGNNLSNYSLSIRITADGFSFFVTEALSGDLIHREDYTKSDGESLGRTLGKMLVRPAIHRLVYNKVEVVVDTDTTCIPLEEFNDEHIDSLYKLVFGNADMAANKVQYTLLTDIGVAVLFTVSDEVSKTVLEIFPEAVFTNTCIMAFERTLAFCQKNQSACCPLFVSLHSKKMYVFSVFEGQLLFFNSFAIENEQNALYFLLSVWKELKLDPRENPCYIGGDDMMQTAGLADGARAYILHVDVSSYK